MDTTTTSNCICDVLPCSCDERAPYALTHRAIELLAIASCTPTMLGDLIAAQLPRFFQSDRACCFAGVVWCPHTDPFAWYANEDTCADVHEIARLYLDVARRFRLRPLTPDDVRFASEMERDGLLLGAECATIGGVK